MSDPKRSLVLSLVSHTNVGKTTLARTWLRREVGEVLDQAHVTDETERFVVFESETGDTVELADTPGFGDSARLLRRLEGRDNPLGWLLGEVWYKLMSKSSQVAVTTSFTVTVAVSIPTPPSSSDTVTVTVNTPSSVYV